MIQTHSLHIFAEPEDADRKKKSSKTKSKGSAAKPASDAKPNISYPTNFEHTVHVGFDAVTGEFTVNRVLDCTAFTDLANLKMISGFRFAVYRSAFGARNFSCICYDGWTNQLPLFLFFFFLFSFI